MMQASLILLVLIFRSARTLLRSRQNQAVVELALRQQLAVYAQQQRRPRLSPLDRAFWVALSRIWPRWKTVLVLVQPETAVRWHRERFRRYWRSISTPGPGRPPISEETKNLILRMATENRWRARKIRGELAMLGIRVSLATISRYLPKPEPGPGQHQRWMTFLRNHRDLIAGMDFFVVPTARFQLLYVWFALDHGRRRGPAGIRSDSKRLGSRFPGPRNTEFLALSREPSAWSREATRPNSGPGEPRLGA